MFAIANIGLVTLLLIGCKSSFQSREAAQKESETNPTIFEDSFFIKGKLAGRIVSWGNFSDPKHELRQKYLGLLMG
ncbi:MAG TPA: hypothetical protein VFQ56_05000, partial [Flavobacterium sp.]|nr:hypothetical protein [Flavobacterium sp.]